MLAGSLQGVVTQALLQTADGQGRIAALEILLPDDAVRNLIRQAKVEQVYSVMQTSTSRGMITMEQSLAKLVLDGVIAKDVALACSSRARPAARPARARRLRGPSARSTARSTPLTPPCASPEASDGARRRADADLEDRSSRSAQRGWRGRRVRLGGGGRRAGARAGRAERAPEPAAGAPRRAPTLDRLADAAARGDLRSPRPSPSPSAVEPESPRSTAPSPPRVGAPEPDAIRARRAGVEPARRGRRRPVLPSRRRPSSRPTRRDRRAPLSPSRGGRAGEGAVLQARALASSARRAEQKAERSRSREAEARAQAEAAETPRRTSTAAQRRCRSTSASSRSSAAEGRLGAGRARPSSREASAPRRSRVASLPSSSVREPARSGGGGNAEEARRPEDRRLAARGGARRQQRLARARPGRARAARAAASSSAASCATPRRSPIALREFFKQHKLPRRGIRLGIANNRIGVRTLDVVGIDDPKQLDNAIKFRAQEVLPIPIEDAVLDYQVLSESVDADGQPSRRVLLVVAYRELVDRYVDACRRPGCSSSASTSRRSRSCARSRSRGRSRAGARARRARRRRDRPRPLDLRRLRRPHLRVHARAPVGRLVAQRRDRARARHLAERGRGRQARALASPAPKSCRTASTPTRSRRRGRRRGAQLQTFARELVSSLQFYQNQPGSLGIGEIVVTGGTAHLPGLGGELERLVGVPVRIGDPLGRVKVSKKAREQEQVGSLAVAIGLGIETDSMRAVNLLPRDEPKQSFEAEPRRRVRRAPAASR